jgi:CHASE3 domain sensor protein
MSSDTTKKSINRYIIALAVIIVALIGGGWWYNNRQLKQDMDNMRETFRLEREFGELNQQIDELSIQYEGFNFKIGNDSLAVLLTTEQAKVQQLMEELRTVKATNTKRIDELKKELETLRKIMRNYVIQIDSLNVANERLTKEKEQAVQRYRSVSREKENLSKELEKQTERVTLASRLDASAITVTPTNERGKEVKRIKQMSQFVVNFRIVKNITAPTGEKTVYVRIMKPDDEVLVKNRSRDVFPFEGKDINFSMKRIVAYDGEELPVTMYWDIEEYLSPGKYRVDIFADGNLIGKKTFELADK